MNVTLTCTTYPNLFLVLTKYTCSWHRYSLKAVASFNLFSNSPDPNPKSICWMCWTNKSNPLRPQLNLKGIGTTYYSTSSLVLWSSCLNGSVQKVDVYNIIQVVVMLWLLSVEDKSLLFYCLSKRWKREQKCSRPMTDVCSSPGIGV